MPCTFYRKSPFFSWRNPRLKSLIQADLRPRFTPNPTLAQVNSSNTRQRVGRGVRQHAAAQSHWLSLNHRKKRERRAVDVNPPVMARHRAAIAAAGTHQGGTGRCFANFCLTSWKVCWIMAITDKVDARFQSQKTCRLFRRGKRSPFSEPTSLRGCCRSTCI